MQHRGTPVPYRLSRLTRYLQDTLQPAGSPMPCLMHVQQLPGTVVHAFDRASCCSMLACCRAGTSRMQSARGHDVCLRRMRGSGGMRGRRRNSATVQPRDTGNKRTHDEKQAGPCSCAVSRASCRALQVMALYNCLSA